MENNDTSNRGYACVAANNSLESPFAYDAAMRAHQTVQEQAKIRDMWKDDVQPCPIERCETCHETTSAKRKHNPHQMQVDDYFDSVQLPKIKLPGDEIFKTGFEAWKKQLDSCPIATLTDMCCRKLEMLNQGPLTSFIADSLGVPSHLRARINSIAMGGTAYGEEKRYMVVIRTQMVTVTDHLLEYPDEGTFSSPRMMQNTPFHILHRAVMTLKKNADGVLLFLFILYRCRRRPRPSHHRLA